jgi:limonene-1,2-epoxide hydrolase
MTGQLFDGSLMTGPVPVVERFLHAVRDDDLDAVSRLLDDDAGYQNVPGAPKRAQDAVLQCRR